MRLRAVLLALLLGLGGCASQLPVAADPGAATAAMQGDAARPAQVQGWVRSELYFGVGSEGDEKNAIIARQGDIVYAVPGTFHSPQFWGKEGLNCRLTNSTMPSLNHVYDAPQ